MNTVGELLEVCRTETECQEQPRRQQTIGEILDQAWMGIWPDKQMDRWQLDKVASIHGELVELKPWGVFLINAYTWLLNGRWLGCQHLKLGTPFFYP